ncbi:MAG: phosphatidate cytidylyltransferase [Sedimentisphaerales bacterium]|nr:phosphatidate cytidylyltransferase [Sedimentisphaerales bacterium]
MTTVLTVIAVFDGWLDGSITITSVDDWSVKATIVFLLLVLVIMLAQIELSRLVAKKGLRVFTILSTAGSIMIAGSWYLRQAGDIYSKNLILGVFAGFLIALLSCQYLRYGYSGVLANCGVNCFCVFYLGVLSSFVLGVRIEFGLWPLLMFVYVVKSADIGAYTIGKLFGNHRFCPGLSKGKSWEGVIGAVVTGAAVAVIFSKIFDIMLWQSAVVFGLCFGFLGQLSDLVESMMKRDAQEKDSARPGVTGVPGFGGVLDIVDSLLLTAPLAYLFFTFSI